MEWNGQEKRHFVRAEFPCKIALHTPCQHIIVSRTSNISAGGLRVIINEKLGLSSLVELELFLSQKPILCKGHVVWVVDYIKDQNQSDQQYDVGIEFFNISEEDKVIISELIESIKSGQA